MALLFKMTKKTQFQFFKGHGTAKNVKNKDNLDYLARLVRIISPKQK